MTGLLFIFEKSRPAPLAAGLPDALYQIFDKFVGFKNAEYDEIDF